MHTIGRLYGWMREDDLDLRNPLSVLGPRRLAFEHFLATTDREADPEGLRPDGSPLLWQYLVASCARTAHGRRWELVGPTTYLDLPRNATAEYLVAALADFGWRLLGTVDADYVFRRPTTAPSPSIPPTGV